MIAGIQQNSLTTTLGRSWYGLPQWPAGQPAFGRQFDAGQFLSELFFPSTQPVPERVGTPYYVELRALSVLQDQLTPPSPAALGTEDALTKLIAGRLWPTLWQSDSQTSPDSTLPLRQVELIGRLIDQVA